jgi:hypothetical protein
MKVGISISIDVTKILKERLFTGAKGTYMDLTTFVDLDAVDQYGNNGFISQSQTKEERQQGAGNTPILGNAKVFYRDDAQQRGQEYAKGTQQAKAAMAPESDAGFIDESIPF